MSLLDTRWSPGGETDLLSEAVDGPHVLVPSRGEPGDDVLGVAGSLARDRDADLLVVRPDAAGQRSAGQFLPPGGTVRLEVVDGLLAAREGGDSPVREETAVAGSVGGIVERAPTTLEVAGMVTLRGDATAGTSFGSVAGLDCDVVFVNDRDRMDNVSSVLFAVAGGPHSGLGAEVAAAVADTHDAWVDVFHVVPPDADRGRRLRGAACVGAGLHLLEGHDRVDRWTLEAPDPTEAIIEQSAYYDVTVLGAPSTGRLRRFVFGSVAETISAEASGPVLVARSGDTDESNWFHLRS